MLKIGLTGGIGAGKSAAANAFAELGALVVDSDKIAREVVEPGTPGLAALVEAFGADVLARDGTLDRPKLAARVFGDDAARAELNAITHPLVAARGQELMDSAPPEQIVVRDIPLLVELGLGPFFHLVVVVDAPLQERLRRLTQVRGMDEEDALARIQAQASDEQRRAAADVWLDNSGSPEDLREQARQLWAQRLSPFNTSLRDGTRAKHEYVVVPQDPSWPAQAERLIGRIRVASGEHALRVDHIGSTSVPGLPAKDVLDLQLTVASLEVADELAQPLAAAGFPGVPGVDHDEPRDAEGAGLGHWAKRFHVSADPGRPANLHIRVQGWPNQRFALLCRDWLRANPTAAEEYTQVKRLAEERARAAQAEGEQAREEAYDQVKEPWFAAVPSRAAEWAAQTDWRP